MRRFGIAALALFTSEYCNCASRQMPVFVSTIHAFLVKILHICTLPRLGITEIKEAIPTLFALSNFTTSAFYNYV
jgi:hypothetical protein